MLQLAASAPRKKQVWVKHPQKRSVHTCTGQAGTQKKRCPHMHTSGEKKEVLHIHTCTGQGKKKRFYTSTHAQVRGKKRGSTHPHMHRSGEKKEVPHIHAWSGSHSSKKACPHMQSKRCQVKVSTHARVRQTFLKKEVSAHAHAHAQISQPLLKKKGVWSRWKNMHRSIEEVSIYMHTSSNHSAKKKMRWDVWNGH